MSYETLSETVLSPTAGGERERERESVLGILVEWSEGNADRLLLGSETNKGSAEGEDVGWEGWSLHCFRSKSMAR